MARGWYQKYIISKSDGSTIDPKADYFVLRLDKDPHAIKALMAYADSVKDYNPKLWEDLIDRINRYLYAGTNLD